MATNIMKGIDLDSKPILTIYHKTLNNKINPVIVNCEQVGSYNWFGSRQRPVIVVPGSPKFFKPWKGGKLKRETGNQMIDENRYMSPDYPMESLFEATKICSKNRSDRCDKFRFQEYDVVCDRNCMRKLYSVLGESDERKETFRINVHRIGRIIVFVRCQTLDKEESPQKNSLFGKNFVTRCTERTLSILSGSYRQIVSYTFGDLKFLVRFEVKCAAKAEECSDECSHYSKEKIKLADISHPRRLDDSNLSVIDWGIHRTYKLKELTTRKVDRTLPSFIYPSMYFAGVNSLVVGWHCWNQCRVEYYSMQDIENEFGGFPNENMSYFYDGLTKIIKFVRDQCECESFAIVWEPFCFKDLKIYEVDTRSTKILPGALFNFVRYN